MTGGHAADVCCTILQVLHNRCKEVGIEEFICKPFRIEDLHRIIAHSRILPRQTAAPILQCSEIENSD